MADDAQIALEIQGATRPTDEPRSAAVARRADADGSSGAEPGDGIGRFRLTAEITRLTAISDARDRVIAEARTLAANWPSGPGLGPLVEAVDNLDRVEGADRG